ncbi:MAG: VOC family protein [Acidimicrobiales bacterium]|jgi:predicted enzyme related to lactoylglutathione lyase
MLRIGTIVINVSERPRAAAFWSGALGYAPRGDWSAKDESAVLVAPRSEAPGITLDEDDHMHLDLHVDSLEELTAEVERLVSLGAKRVDWPYPDGARFVVLADTEDNLFCVVNAGG